MTRRHVKFLLTVVFLVLAVLIYWRNVPTKQGHHLKVKDSIAVDSIVPVLYKDSGRVDYEGILKPAEKVNVSFSIDGTLMTGDFPLELGKIVRENDILFKLDIYTLYKEISAKKKALKAIADRLNKEIVTNYADQKNVWDTFTSNVLPTKRLPGLPTFMIKSKNPLFEEFTKTYEEVERLEAQIEDYYVFAPFSGTIVSLMKKIGEQTRAGECVAQIAPFQIYFAEFKVPKEDLVLLKLKDAVSLSVNKKQVKGRVIKISLNKDGSFATVECSLSKTVVKEGEKITLQVQRKSEWAYIPSHLLRNDSLWISRQGRSLKIHATIMDWKKDSVAIKELKLGDLVLRKRPSSGVISCP
jgi:hypothetical protein